MYYRCIKKFIAKDYCSEIFYEENKLIFVNTDEIWFLKYIENKDCVMISGKDCNKCIKISENILNTFF